VHNKWDTPQFSNDPFQQKIEPAGKYITHVPKEYWDTSIENQERGTITFNNPLVIKVNPKVAVIYDENSWKKRLQKTYKKTGKALSAAIAKEGFDGIVTVRAGETSEIVDLTFLHELKKSGPFIGPRGGKWADAKHTIPWKQETKTQREAEKTTKRISKRNPWGETEAAQVKPRFSDD
jgi:hypothetical protein